MESLDTIAEKVTEDQIRLYVQKPISSEEEVDNRLIIVKELGRGAFGITYLVQDRRSKLYMVMKRTNYNVRDTSYQNEFMITGYVYNHLPSLYRRHVVRIYSHFEYNNRNEQGVMRRNVVLFQQLIPGMSLLQLNQKMLVRGLTALNMMYQLLAIVRALAKINVSHNDLSLNNILWSSKHQNLVLIDMGLTCYLSTNVVNSCTRRDIIHNRWYNHPQFKTETATLQQVKGNDIWGLLLVMLNVLVGTIDEKRLIRFVGPEWMYQLNTFFRSQPCHRMGWRCRLWYLIANCLRPLDRMPAAGEIMMVLNRWMKKDR